MGFENLENIDLLTRSGERAATVKTLPWKIPPEGLMWGERTFFRQADGRYLEGLMFWVPPQLYVEPSQEAVYGLGAAGAPDPSLLQERGLDNLPAAPSGGGL